jgi:dipeptidyl aminopeptidase/acylaminoacyl peptidase
MRPSRKSLWARGLGLAVMWLCLGWQVHDAQAVDRMPTTLSSSADAGPGRRPWAIKDIVEIRRLTGIAISEKTRQVAFVVKQSFLDGDEIRYALYVAEPHAGNARKIVECAFMDELAWHPDSSLWTVRGDFGSGIQLYDIDSVGQIHPLVVNPRTVSVGAAESVIDGDADEGPRETGIASYEWAPDGAALWYSLYRLRDVGERSSMARNGVVYDDREMFLRAFGNDPTLALGAELHLWKPAEARDRMLLFVPGGLRIGTLFNSHMGSAFWDRDSRHIQYSLWLSKLDASVDLSKWSIDVSSGEVQRLTGDTIHDLFSAIPAPDGRGYLTVRLNEEGEGHHLVGVADAGVVKDYGPVGFNNVGSRSGLGAWPGRDGTLIAAVAYDDRSGLTTIPASRASRALEAVKENLSHCTFTRNPTYGVCVRESATAAPELVEVSLVNGAVLPLVSVNPGFAAIDPLRVERAEWVNRYGGRGNGYITYPRVYAADHRYPTIVITHGKDARNEFATAGFQWEFPLQVLAEQGYLVLSVNEPRDTSRTRAASEARAGTKIGQSVSDIQFGQAFNAIASMEAAVMSVMERGLADPDKTGIAGYSRGAEIVEWAMTQSKLFHVAVEGDSGGSLAGHYGLAGWAPLRAYYRQLYGGSPFDAEAQADYRRLSASFRSKEFAGPLLQLFAKGNGIAGLELHSLLRDAGIPTEFTFFPHESHVFWDPEHRAAAMRHTLNWFDYWLLGKRNPDETEQYARWDAMAAAWHKGAP